MSKPCVVPPRHRAVPVFRSGPQSWSPRIGLVDDLMRSKSIRPWHRAAMSWILVALAGLCLVSLGSAANAVEREDDGLQALAIRYYADKYRIDPERARARLEIQDRAAGIDDALIAELGDDYAGIWYDPNKAGRLQIGLARAGSARLAALQRVVEAFGLTADTDWVSVNRTERDLTELRDAMRPDLHDLLNTARANMGYDTRRNSVIVRAVTRVTPTEEATLRSLASIPGVIVQRVPADTLAATYQGCWITACNPPLRGGRGVIADGFCTGAFIAYTPNSPHQWLLTAGHCMYFEAIVGDGYAWHARNEAMKTHLISAYVNYTFAGPNGRDAGIIWLQPSSYWATPAPIAAVVVKISDDTTYNPSYEIRQTSFSAIGQILCRTGRMTGTDCAEVSLLGADETAKGPNGLYYGVRNMGEVDACGAQGGDSGGPLYKKHRAYGIYSGRVNAGPAFCWEFYQGVRDAEKALGVKVLLAP